MESKRFMDVKDVSEYLSVSVPMAYKIMRELNNELKAQGYITVSGRVSRAYFETKVYGQNSARVPA